MVSKTVPMIKRLLIALVMFLAWNAVGRAQEAVADSAVTTAPHDSLLVMEDIASSVADVEATLGDKLPADGVLAIGQSADKPLGKRPKRDWSTWRPDTKRAMWLALVLPGAGQVYNRKYWKLPIIYGGFAGCIYAMTWNNQMYKDYSQAYLDIMDDDPNTQSYNNFLHLGTKIDETNITRYQEIFRKRKNRYRRWRDLSVFATIAVYALSVIDAYVDASLSEFDISEDLSLRVAPVVMGNGGAMTVQRGPLGQHSVGLGCALRF